jgi:hypothetical protein
MNEPSQNAWKPDPELLAAYFDGELEGRDDVADVRARMEAWLEGNAEAAEQYAEHQQLNKLMRDTTPAEPSAAAWKQTLERIDAERKRPALAPTSRRRSWVVMGAIAASVLLAIGLFGAMRSYVWNTPNRDIAENGKNFEAPEETYEMLEVALASEVTILRIDTDDIEGVIVGTMPVSAPLELADPGSVCVSCKCPRIVVRQDPPNRPMVWAVAASD